MDAYNIVLEKGPSGKRVITEMCLKKYSKCVDWKHVSEDKVFWRTRLNTFIHQKKKSVQFLD